MSPSKLFYLARCHRFWESASTSNKRCLQ